MICKTAFRFVALLAVIVPLIVSAGSVPAAAGDRYTDQDKSNIESCIEKAQRNSQHARVCIGAATRPCESRPEMASNQGTKDCMAREHAYWDEMLNDRFQKLIAMFSKENASKLRKMQRTWIDWRKQKCELAYMLYDGGSIASVLAADCLMETTAIRAIELDQAVIAP